MRATTTTNIQHECEFCGESFGSRNALFRHVRSDPACSRLANPSSNVLLGPIKYILGLQFSYWQTTDKSTTIDIQSKLCGERLKNAVRAATNSLIESDLKTDAASVIVSSTQVSLPRLRHRALSQEPGCFAAGDVATLTLMAPKGLVQRDESREESQNRVRRFLHQLRERTNLELKNDDCDDTSIAIRLDACKLLSSDTKFHAERSCTQRIIHYLMPLQWLPDGEDLERWWIANELLDNAGPHSNRAATRPPSNSLKVLKNALRSAQSPQLEQSLTKQEAALLSIKSAAGRFGNLSKKKRLPFHNFADPNLRGDASPNNEPVWRVLDRAGSVEMIRTKDDSNHDRVAVVLEFRGDDFLPEQIRRIVGTAVAITHGWLPPDTFDTARQREVVLETPLAPAGRMYLAESRFHFDELKSGGQSIFCSDTDGLYDRDQTASPILDIQAAVLAGRASKEVERLEANWLSSVKEHVAPRMRRQLEQLQVVKLTTADKMVIDDPMQETECYQLTLQHLRDIVSAGRWPETSAARSNVISNIFRGNAKPECNGSFTVVNPEFQNGLYRNGIGEHRLPLANELFPELTKAVFDLELELSKQHLAQAEGDSRPTSSHCAINCNAQFTPHVDSGRGAGQSLSMIVGLGDYAGGELAVEGEHHGIRYRPLEFDGWRLRHWTLPFTGERFSLVWFTPEVQN